MSGFGISKDLLVKKVPAKKMGDLIMPKSILRVSRIQASFMSREGKMDGTRDRRKREISESHCSPLVFGVSTL